MSREQDIKILLVKYERRLQKLKEQKAAYGLDTRPHILIEIEDLEAEIETLRVELKNVEKKTSLNDHKAETIRFETPVEEKLQEFDVVISFSGEDRHIASAINSELQAVGINTFFDQDHKLRLWGANLAEELLWHKTSAYG